MAATNPSPTPKGERLDLRGNAWPLYVGAMLVGGVGMIVAIALGYRDNATYAEPFRRYFFSYLAGYMFFLAITLGSLFFVLLQHATKAGWSVNVRRAAEWLASSLPVMAVLSAPILLSIVLNRGSLYPWAVSADKLSEEITKHPFKAMYLKPIFVVARLLACFAVWSVLGVGYWKMSVKQDATGDPAITRRMQALAPIGLILFGVTLTVACIDLVMTLDPGWYSTIFGVYYFADAALACFATLILTMLILQSRGFLKESVTVEHYHDLGKFLFGFTFFWGYIAYSQYMLQWYGNMPEETEWYARHGATTAKADPAHPFIHLWSPVVLALLFGHLLIPFAGLLSRHVKRNPKFLGFWAVWQLAFVWLDIFWIIMPQLDKMLHFNLIDVAVFLGIGGLLTSVVLRKAAHDLLRPTRDPRLDDSLAFVNF